MKPKLPQIPNKLIRLAVADLIKCAADPAYVIDMLVWHEPIDEQCHVCLGGSVLAQEFDIQSDWDASPHDSYDEDGGVDNYRALLALDRFRDGDIKFALDKMCINLPPGVPELALVTDYSRDPERFIAQMLEIADMLERAGL